MQNAAARLITGGPHDARATPAALASCPATSVVPGHMPGALVVIWAMHYNVSTEKTAP